MIARSPAVCVLLASNFLVEFIHSEAEKNLHLLNLIQPIWTIELRNELHFIHLKRNLQTTWTTAIK